MKRLIFVIGLTGLFLISASTTKAADIEAVLDDAAGASAFSVKDSGSVEGAHIDSDGNVVIKGGVRLDSAGTEYTTAEDLIVDGKIGVGDITPDGKLDFDLSSTSTGAGPEYGANFTVSDTGIAAAGDTTYGLYMSTARTGLTSVGTINTYGLYSTVTGDTGGTSTAFGIYATASGADTNYAIYATGSPSADVANVYSENTGNNGTAGSFVSTATGVGSSAKGIYVRNDGRDDVAAHIETNNTLATAQALYITSNSTQSPDVVTIAPTGNMAGGNALVITNTGATNSARGMYLRNDGSGASGAHMEINNTANSSQVIYAITSGTGYDASFIRNNTSTTTADTAVELKHTVSTGATGGADGIGAALIFNNETSTDGTEHATAKIAGVLTTAAAATSKGELVFSYASVNAFKEGMRLLSTGNLQFEGATENAFDTTFSITDPTANRTITIPDANVNLGTINTNSHAQNTDTGTTATTFEIDNDAVAGLILDATGLATSDKTFTFPNVTSKVLTNNMSDAAVAVTLNNAADALNFDSNTLSIDALNNTVGIGDTTPDARIDVDSAADASVDSLGVTHTTTTTGANAVEISVTQSDDLDATDTNTGMTITATSSSGDADTLLGINIGNITAGTATENAIRIGTGWDSNIVITEDGTSKTKIDLASGAGNAKWIAVDSGWFLSFVNDGGFKFYNSSGAGKAFGTNTMSIENSAIYMYLDPVVGSATTNRWLKMYGNILFEESDDYLGSWGAYTITLGNIQGTATATTFQLGRPSGIDIFNFNVGFKVPVAAKTAAYTATTSDMVLTGDGTAAAFSITLPAAAGNTGRSYTIKKIDSSANAVTVDPNLAETIDGAATYALSAQWKYVTAVSNGTNWIITANN